MKQVLRNREIKWFLFYFLYGYLVIPKELSLEQHGFELHGSAYTQIFFNEYIGKIFGDLQQLEKTYELHSLEILEKLRKRYV